jgi:hypothetical protein
LIAARALGLALALLASIAAIADDANDAQHAAQEREARQKLDAVRAEIKALAEQQHATEDQRNEAARTLRAKETEVAGVAK